MRRSALTLTLAPRAIVLVAACLAISASRARGDEFRLKDGEILYGTIEARDQERLHVRVGPTELRRIRASDVDQILAGVDPLGFVAQNEEALAEQGAVALEGLALHAWEHGLDSTARRLAERVVALDAETAEAQWLLGRHRDQGTWIAGFPPGWGRPGRTGPRWGGARKRALSQGGATAQSEAAVRRALDWLAAHQDEDGKLDADGFQRHDPEAERCDGQGGGHHGERVPCGYDGVTTAVALLGWLASGSTPVSGPYREHVARALTYCRSVTRAGPGGAYGLWNHGFCTQALADAYAVTRDGDLRRDLERAVDGILRLQLADGGWSYYMGIGDVPTTGVAASGLALANQAGIVIPAERVERLLGFLDARVDAGSGRSEYHAGAEQKGYTPTRANAAAGLAVRALFGRLSKAPNLGRQVAAISEKPVWKLEFKEVKTRDGRSVQAQIGNLYPYLWFYATMALRERGGGSWSAWFGALKKALLAGQRQDGSAAGSWDPLGQYSTSAGRVFVTGLCALMLQAPYRYPRAR